MDGVPVLELRDVAKRLGGATVVHGVSFSLWRGQVMALLGPSGCGKTTTLRMIAGFTDADEGEIRIGGRDVRGRRPYERNVGLVFQDYALFPHLTVAQNVAYGMKQRGFARAGIPGRVSAMLDLVRLGGFAERRPAELSGGQRQRVALARALATEPELVLLDEPLSALDAKLRQDLQLELKEILSASQAATIIVTHDQDEAMGLAEHMVVMGHGTILQAGSPAEIYRKPRSAEVARFIGRSNWFPGQLREPGAGGLAVFETGDGDLPVRLAERPRAPGRGHLCVRPEALRILAAHGQPVPGAVLHGRIIDVTCLGAAVHVVAELGSGLRVLIIEHGPAGERLARGRDVGLAFDPGEALFFGA